MRRNRMTQQIANSEDFSSHVNEVTRRMAVLDFLGLYEQARQDGIIGRIKYITQSAGFSDYEPKGWEIYITRLLGRCLRYWIPYSGVIEKQRNRMAYQLFTSNIPEFHQVARVQSILTCQGQYHPHYRLYRAANNSPREYWRTREGMDAEVIDTLYRWYDMYRGRIDALTRIRVGHWPGATIDYGQPLYGGGSYYYRYRQTQTRTVGRYNSSESYMEFKQLLEIVGSLHQDPEMFEMLEILANYDVRDEQRRERDNDLAQRNARVRTVHQTQVRDIPNERLLEELRRRGLVTEGRVADDTPQEDSPLATRLLERLRARGRIA